MGGSFIWATLRRIDGSSQSPRAVRSGSSPGDPVSSPPEGMPSVCAGARRSWRALHCLRANRALQQSRSWVRRAVWTAMPLFASCRYSSTMSCAQQKPAGEGAWGLHAQRRPERSMIAPATLAQHWALKSPVQIGTKDLAKRFNGIEEKAPEGIGRGRTVFGRRYAARRRAIAQALPMKALPMK